MKGIERIAASWAEQNGIQQVRFGLDRKLGDRAGFRRNEQMLSLKPRYVIRSEEHTSELQSLMRISYAVFCLKKKKKTQRIVKKNRGKHEQLKTKHNTQN